MVENYDELLTSEGHEFIQKLIEGLQEHTVDTVKDEYGVEEFRGGSLGRRILPLPDEYVEDSFLGTTDLDTFFVLKVSSEPLPHNYREIQVWKQACRLGWEHESLFAPIHAWDTDYRWLIMERVTPISPIENDLAYLLSGQQYVYDPEAPELMEAQLDKLGWTVEDVEMNIGLLRNGLCMMDYGGVNRKDNPIELPNHLQ